MYGSSRHQGKIMQNVHMRPSSLAPLHSDLGEHIWKTWALGKCHFFLWLAAYNKYWATDRLAHRGLPHPTRCPHYDLEEETINHLLVSCVIVQEFGLFCYGKWVYQPFHHNKMNPPLMNGGPRQSQEWMVHTKKNSTRLSSLEHG